MYVTGVIKSYHRKGLSYLKGENATTENYRVGVVAHVTVRDSVSDKLVLEKDVKGYTLVNVGSDLASADRQAQLLLAEDLAKNISELITEGAW